MLCLNKINLNNLICLMTRGRKFLNSQTTSTRRVKAIVILCLLLGQAGLSASAHADETKDSSAVAMDLVRSMSKALKSLNYEGTFVHMISGNVETMRILHARDESGELERMTSLNGEAREVFRNNHTVTCIWPGSRSVVVSKSKPRDLIPEVNSSLVDNDFYKIILDTPDRVAGRETHVVHVAPTDSDRYGYRFWIDKETSMLLRMMLLDENGNGLEQLMFTDIRYPDSIDPARFEATGADDTFTWQEPKPEDVVPTPQPQRIVSFENLPDGYSKIAETYNPMPMGDTPLSHVTLSDGMASVSVYVEYMEAELHDSGSSGISRMGVINAFGLARESAFITVVGEVPANVVQRIGESVIIEGQEG